MSDFPYVSDRGDGTYVNPVLFADYSDPDVIRVGGDFYMASSSFNFSPGLPILHSTDLVNWRILANALEGLPSPRYEEVKPGAGVWAPAIRHHGGQFWIFFPTPDEGIYVLTAEDVRGPWSEPRLLMAGQGLIDPCPLWDDDGKAYLVFAYAGSRAGIKSRLHVVPMAADASAITGEGRLVFDGASSHPTLEGPKFHKKDGWYYLSAPAGGVAYGWQLILRSRSVYGPYEERIALAQRGTTVNGPHQGALVDDVEGNWWFFHFQELQPYGRVCHLQPVDWRDGWPYLGAEHDAAGVGKPVHAHKKPAGNSGIQTPATSDEFDGKELGLQWAFSANFRRDFYDLGVRPGHIRLFAGQTPRADLSVAPWVLSQKIPAPSFNLETTVDFHPKNPLTEAGLAVIGLESGQLCVTGGEEHPVLALKKNGSAVQSQPCPRGLIRLVLRFAGGGAYQFGFRQDGEEARIEWIGPTFQAKEGLWVGARVGIYCGVAGPFPARDHADFDYFRFSPFGC